MNYELGSDIWRRNAMRTMDQNILSKQMTVLGLSPVTSSQVKVLLGDKMLNWK